MKFIRDMISRKSQGTSPEVDQVADFESVIGYGEEERAKPARSETPVQRAAKVQVVDPAPAAKPVPAPAKDPAPEARAAQVDEEASKIIDKLGASLTEQSKKSAVNIWDMEDENDTPVAPAPAPGPSSRRRRNKTRVLGFDGSDSSVVDLFEDAQKTKPAERTKFPVGWMLVAEGPGRGECFTLEAGMSQIGRGDDQAIQLDFGDNSISRSNHAAVVYDTESHSFTLGHGGKKNIVRLNGNPVISNEAIKTGDKIKIGETTLHFVALCSEDFNWSDDSDGEESEDVAIA